VPGTTYSRVRDLLANGENDSAATLAIRAVGPPVLRYLRAILRDEDDTKDAFSHWAESMWRGLPGFHWKSSLQTWAYRHAYHAALGLRDEAWRRHGRRFETGEASRIAATIRTATGVRVERQRAILRQLREALTLEEQTLLDLRIDQGLTWEAIAEVLGREGDRLDACTVAKRFERLKARLGEMLKREGVHE
jgi:RNA polymerase sigma-70 factor, ECF subfamily